VILIIDEFDSLEETFINSFAGIFRDMFISRTNQGDRKSKEKTNLLHGLALVGVRSVLGIENVKGSPLNVQQNLNIPALTADETKKMFRDYEIESRQHIKPEVIDRLFYETKGQPGLVSWFGELLTETYNSDKNKPVTMERFKYVYKEATNVLPNNNILNIISKAKQEPHKQMALELFKTDWKMEFRFDDESMNYLYMNGIADIEREIRPNGELEIYCKFSCPFVQSRLFNYFAREIFDDLGSLIHPLDNMEDAISGNKLNIPNIIKRYKTYLMKNKELLFKDVPRRKKDLRIYEAVYHFNLYRFLYDLLTKRNISVVPEFPTGNGKIDLILKYNGQIYALELKSFKDMYDFNRGIEQAEEYGRKLQLKEIFLLIFVELTEEEVKELEQETEKSGIKINVIPIGVL
jgi:hypothetical protein